MDLDKLYDILASCTVQLRKGEEVQESQVGGVKTTHIYAMPHTNEIDDPDVVKVDIHFIVVGVDKREAESHREEFLALLRDWPSETWGSPVPPISSEVNYLVAGAVLGDQGAAFQFFALGEVLGLWKVLTPEVMGITGEFANQLAGMGMISISGLEPQDA